MTDTKRHMAGGVLQGWLIDLVTDGQLRQGITQAQLAARVGVSQKHLSAVLNGHAMATLTFWDQALFVLGIDIADLG